MALAHAILGFLSTQSFTGYDLKTQCFDRSVRYFWSADQAQIYRTLDKLQQEGSITSEIEIQNGKPNRKIYSITEQGREVLDIWLRTHQDLPVWREPFLMQIYFAKDLKKADMLDQITYQRSKHFAALQEYLYIHDYFLEQLKQELPQEIFRDITLKHMTLQLGIRTEESYLEWLDDLRRSLEKIYD